MKTVKWILTAALLTAFAIFARPACASWTHNGGVNVTNSGDTIRWGIPDFQEQSGLNFAFSSTGSGEHVLVLGILTHYNRSVEPGTSPLSCTLVEYDLAIITDETLNVPGSPGDILSFPGPYQYGDLTILGFGPSPLDIWPSMTTAEFTDQSVSLWGFIPAVPVPGAALLVGIGCIFVRRRYG